MTILFKEGCSTPVNLGEKGENKVTAIQFDYSAWIEEYGNGAISLLVKRKGDTAAYPVVLSTADGIATWTISDTDTAVQGYGKAEYIFTIDSKVAKSAVFSFYVAADLGPSGDPPDPYESWIDTLTELGGETLINAQAAQAAQSGAEAAQASAETAATNAATSATNAAQSAGAARDMAASALSSADRATASATAASGHATAAEAAKDLAISAAEDAQHSETQAELSASAAAESAESASGSATTATTAATNAAASATSASGSATAAATSETNAAQSATEAEASAQEAATEAAKLNNYLPTDTASGAIASFPDGADGVPVEALTVSLEPIQNLHGQNSPYPAGGGKNKFDASFMTATGITVTGNTVVGKGSAFHNAFVTDGIPNLTFAENTRYTLSMVASTDASASQSGNGLLFRFTYTDSTSSVLWLQNTSTTPTSYQATSDAGKTVSKITMSYGGTSGDNTWTLTNIQLEQGSSATAYTPYSNICPITGHTQAQVWRSGTNIFDESVFADIGAVLQEDGTYYFQTASAFSNKVIWTNDSGYTGALNLAIKYRYSSDSSSGVRPIVHYTDGTSTQLYMSATATEATYTYTTNSAKTVSNITLTYGSGSVGTWWNFAMSPQSLTAYESPSIVHISIPLGQTVYGGTVDVVGGKVVVECVKSALTSFIGAWGVTGSGYYGVYTSISDCERDPYNKGYYFKCNRFAFSKLGYDQMPLYSFCGGSGALTTLTFILPSTITSLAEANAWLVDNPTEFTYNLATPITIDLTPEQLTTLLGQNNVWSDSGDVDVTYRADIQKYITKVIAEAIA